MINRSTTKRYNSLLVLLMVITIGLFACNKKTTNNKLTTKQPTLNSYPKAPGGENRPILPASMYKGKAAKAYKLAKEIPHVLDKVFCYCYCEYHPKIKHKSLKSCFATDHGANCNICQNQAIMAYELYKQGLSTDKIVQAENQRFYSPLRR